MGKVEKRKTPLSPQGAFAKIANAAINSDVEKIFPHFEAGSYEEKKCRARKIYYLNCLVAANGNEKFAIVSMSANRHTLDGFVVTPKILKEWQSNDEEFANVCDYIPIQFAIVVEKKLNEMALIGNMTAAKLLLETRGAELGYSPKSETETGNGAGDENDASDMNAEKLGQLIENFKNLSESELIKKMEEAMQKPHESVKREH